MNIEYRLATVEDFLAVPQESIAACLNDFAIWIDIARQAKQGNLPPALDIPGFSLRTDCFKWADDGQRGMSAVDITTHDGEYLGRIELDVTQSGINPDSPPAK